MPGAALGIPDDLSHGPLDDVRARIGYMRERFRGYDDWYLDVTDAFAPWRAMIARLDEAGADAVVIWSGDNASEATFLSMACWWLRNRPERVLRVAMPGTEGRHYVAIHTPAELADLFASARELTDTERAVSCAAGRRDVSWACRWIATTRCCWRLAHQPGHPHRVLWGRP